MSKLWNKKEFHTSKLLKAGIFSLLFGVIAGCSAPRELVGSEKDQLIQRVTDRWQCLVQNDYVCAYNYTTPAYRDVFSQDLYKIGKGSMLERRLTGAKVVDYDPTAAVASVEVGVMSRSFKHTSSASRTIGPRFTTIRERWLWSGGKWWYYEGS